MVTPERKSAAAGQVSGVRAAVPSRAVRILPRRRYWRTATVGYTLYCDLKGPRTHVRKGKHPPPEPGRVPNVHGNRGSNRKHHHLPCYCIKWYPTIATPHIAAISIQIRTLANTSATSVFSLTGRIDLTKYMRHRPPALVDSGRSSIAHCFAATIPRATPNGSVLTYS